LVLGPEVFDGSPVDGGEAMVRARALLRNLRTARVMASSRISAACRKPMKM
jgi:hypothetical protein